MQHVQPQKTACNDARENDLTACRVTIQEKRTEVAKKGFKVIILLIRQFMGREIMFTRMKRTWSGQPYPLFDFMEVPIISKWKADLRLFYVSAQTLSNCGTIWSLGKCQFSTWACRCVFLCICHSCPVFRLTSAIMFSSGTVHQYRSLLCPSCILLVQHRVE